jgi:hypothetical protein
MSFVEDWTPAYKGFTSELKSDIGGGFQYEVGKEYVHEGEVSCCSSGFHCCESLQQTFVYYPPSSSRYFKVEYRGHVDRKVDKFSASEIRLVEEVNLFDFYKNHRTYTDDTTHLMIDLERFDGRTVCTQRYFNERECVDWKPSIYYGENFFIRYVFNKNGVFDSPRKTPEEPYGKFANLYTKGSVCITAYFDNGVCTYRIFSDNFGSIIRQEMLVDLLTK